jgi:hypothetical protein
MLCKVDWEIGPLQQGGQFLAFSPSQVDDECYSAVKLMIASAPNHPNWKFTLFKPPRVWFLEFDLELAGGTRTVDGKLWEFIIYAFKDGTFDILFKPDISCDDLEKDALLNAAIVIVDGELGEAARRATIGEIEIVKHWNPDVRHKARLLKPGLLQEIIAERAMAKL